MNSGIIAFTGYNTRAVVAFCRFLKMRGLQAHLIARDEHDPIFLTDFHDWVFLTRDDSNLEIGKCLGYFKVIKSVFTYKSLIILPTSEFINRFFLSHHSEAKRESVVIPLVNNDLYKSISDKASFRTICTQHGLDVPALVLPDSVKFPLVAKKKQYEAGPNIQAKPYLIFSEDDYTRFCQQETLDNHFLEEYVDGESHYLLYHIAQSGCVVSFSQQNLIQQSDGHSIIAARPSDVHTRDIAERYSMMLTSLGFHGFIMIEVRKRRDDYLTIEANPRFWGPFQFVVDNCPAMFDQFLLDQGIQPPSSGLAHKPYPVIARDYFWYGGYVSEKLRGCTPSFHEYDQMTMNNELHRWLVSDVFLREDTIKLFRAEIESGLTT